MEINLDFLIKNKLTPNQFVILDTLSGNLSGNSRSNLLKQVGIVDADYRSLLERGFINKSKNKYIITELTTEMFTDGNMFRELLEMYPTKVRRQDGAFSYLKTDRRRAEARYRKVTRNRADIHEHIMSCLQLEIQERSKTDNLKWMKTLPNWIQSEGWLEWGEKLKERKFDPIDHSETNMPYGSKLI